VTMGMVIVGLSAALGALFGDTPRARGAVLAGCLFALAMGLRLPHSVALWIGAAVWHRLSSVGGSARIRVDPAPGQSPDQALQYIVLAVMELLAGVSAALLPALSETVSAAYAWLHLHFVWSSLPRAALHVLLACLASIVPLAPLGLAVACAHRLKGPYGRWDPTTAGWVLIGASAGALAGTWIVVDCGRPALALVSASLPALMVSLLSAASSSPAACKPKPQRRDTSDALPSWSDRRPRLLRAAIVVAGVSGVGCTAIWAGRWSGAAWGNGTGCVAGLLFASGVGFVFGCSRNLAGVRSIGGFGVACALAGAILVAVMVWVSRLSPVAVWSPLAPAMISLCAVGAALGYGLRVLLDRVAQRTTAGLMIWSRIIAWGALVTVVGAPLSIRYLGSTSSFALVALGLLALGAMLIVREPAYSPRARRLRLGGVFAAIAAMIPLVPRPTPSDNPNPVDAAAVHKVDQLAAQPGDPPAGRSPEASD